MVYRSFLIFSIFTLFSTDLLTICEEPVYAQIAPLHQFLMVQANPDDNYQQGLGAPTDRRQEQEQKAKELYNKGIILFKQYGHPEKGLEYYQQALAIFQELSDRPLEAKTLCANIK